MSDNEQADDTALPIMEDQAFRAFCAGKMSHAGQPMFIEHMQQASAEMTRRLFRQQLKSLEAQNRLIESLNQLLDSQGAVAISLKRATWALFGATVALVAATVIVATWFSR